MMRVLEIICAIYIGFCVTYTTCEVLKDLWKLIKKYTTKKNQPPLAAVTINYSELRVGTIEHRDRFVKDCDDDELKLLHRNFPKNLLTIKKVSQAIVKSVFGTENDGHPLGEKWKTLCLWTLTGDKIPPIDGQFFDVVKFNPENYGFGFPKGSESISIEKLTLTELVRVSELREDYKIGLNIGADALFFRRGNNLFLLYNYRYRLDNCDVKSVRYNIYATDSLLQFQLT